MENKISHKNSFLIKLLISIAPLLLTLILSLVLLGIQSEKLNDTVPYLRHTITWLFLLMIILYLFAYILHLPYNFKKLNSENSELKILLKKKNEPSDEKNEIVSLKEEIKYLEMVIQQFKKEEDEEELDNDDSFS